MACEHQTRQNLSAHLSTLKFVESGNSQTRHQMEITEHLNVKCKTSVDIDDIPSLFGFIEFYAYRPLPAKLTDV